jgi:lipoprotein-releasing system permease protein
MLPFRYERWIAWRYLRPSRSEGFVSVITGFSLVGIALGVATLIIVMSVMNGFRHELIGKILGASGTIQITHAPDGIAGYDAILRTVKAQPEVESAIPQVEGQCMAMANGQAAGVMVKGQRASDIAARALLRESMEPGALEAFEQGEGVLIGYRLAETLGAKSGDTISIVSPQGFHTVLGSLPRVKTVRVAGLFNMGMHLYDSGLVYLPLEEAQQFFRLPEDTISGIEIVTLTPEIAPIVASRLRSVLPVEYEITDWRLSHAQFFNALQVERNVMFLILTLIILIAAFNIISGLVMLVKDKRQGIAILMTMGAGRRNIARIFWICGASIGITGTLAGLALGVGFAANIERIRQGLQTLTGTELFSEEIYFLSQLPAIIEPREVMVVCGMSLALSFLATLYPAWRASRLHPVESLRHE